MQLELFNGTSRIKPARRTFLRRQPAMRPPLCQRCRLKPAHYGLRDDDRPERSATFCFECFRLELERHPRK